MSAPAPVTPFRFAMCQIGAERALKQELARTHPELRFAYSRPGFVTFKRAAAPVALDAALDSVFARAHGACFGAAAGPDEAGAIGQLAALARELGPAGAPGRRPRLHVFPRDPAHAGLAADLRARILGEHGALFLDDPVARRGDRVLDVIVAAGEPAWLGAHLHGEGHSPWPGGWIPVEVPPEAPSRAYAKLEEALAWSGAPVERGDVALEIGSAPGGASYALLRRGVHVVGVDPGEMSPVVLACVGPGGARLTHVKKPVGALARADLPARAEWLLVDVNLAPQVALHTIRRLVPPLRPALRGVLFTLKLNDWAMAAELPALRARVEAMGLTQVRATQLPSNRQEVFVIGLAPRGQRRRGQRRA